VTAAAEQGGLDRAAVAAMLESERYAAEVRADEREAGELGISAVPFFVIDRRYGLAGAQPPAILVAALRRALADRSVFT
jgi:predicted DsbA family dithiol-disulfide isomerase